MAGAQERHDLLATDECGKGRAEANAGHVRHARPAAGATLWQRARGELGNILQGGSSRGR